MKRYDAAIIGGGAAGITAAIGAKRKGRSSVICEKMPRLGKKILISGGGRCNLSNEDLNEAHYNAPARDIVKAVFSRFGGGDIRNFFDGLGLKMRSEEGRIFPVTDQASSVLKVLELELERLAVDVELNFDVSDISGSSDGFAIRSSAGKTVSCGALIMACGGKAYPALGSDGSGYALAKQFGHSIIEPVPSAVSLVVKDRLCHMLQGQRICAKIRGIVGGRKVSEASGELLFTKYGLSGTAILDISAELSIAINRDKNEDVWVECDLVPFMEEEKLAERLGLKAGLVGILPNKFEDPFKGSSAAELKGRRFRVLATRGWNEAEFTAGGIDTKEVREGTLESKLRKGLYFAGEILDVDGRRGGYNLTWAWASGMVTGGLT